MEETPALNGHNKQEFPPMHTAEHLLNALMVKTFGCERSRNAHIERKKSKISYDLPTCPSDEQIAWIADEMNHLIQSGMEVTYDFVTIDQLPAGVQPDRLPDNVSEAIRLSCQQTRGMKFDLFVLDLSFIGWNILSNTLYVGYLVQIWAMPYINLSYALYYEALSGRDIYAADSGTEFPPPPVDY